MEDREPFVVRSHNVHLDSEYTLWIADLKQRYQRAQVRTAVKVNMEQLLFNWQLGSDLVVRRAEERWGFGVVEQVSLDLQAAFPEVKGFSVRNLWNMKKWYSFYASSPDIRDKMDSLEKSVQDDTAKLHQIDAETRDKILHQSGAELPFPLLFAFVPWRHHVEITARCRTVDEALYYIKITAQEGYSRSALLNLIAADLYHSSGAAVTNFSETLPLPQGRLAQEIIKSNYDLGFITLPADYDEKKLETAIEQNITRFLLELGTGFAFIGRQKEIVVAGKTRRIDLLFYHIRLRCYVVVELKVTAFEPEFAGKLNFYVSAVDELLKTRDDNPTIGLLVCRDMNHTEVKWAFRNIHTPIGVAVYQNIQTEEMQTLLPTEDQIRQCVDRAQEEYHNQNERIH